MTDAYFSHDPETGIAFHANGTAAKTAALRSIEDAVSNAADNDWQWQENEDEICWGTIGGKATIIDREQTISEQADCPNGTFTRVLKLEESPAGVDSASVDRAVKAWLKTDKHALVFDRMRAALVAAIEVVK